MSIHWWVDNYILYDCKHVALYVNMAILNAVAGCYTTHLAYMIIHSLEVLHYLTVALEAAPSCARAPGQIIVLHEA